MQISISALQKSIGQILQNLHATEAQWRETIQKVHSNQRVSATNLLHYLALRLDDLRELQDDLHNAGLSSLASSESHLLHQVQMVQQRLGVQIPEKEWSTCDYPTARQLSQRQTNALFGPKSNPNIPHLMVTFDTGLAHDYFAVKELVQAGMTVARINCAHDDPATWLLMINNVRKASRSIGQPCKVYMDLAGPKIRTLILGKGRKKGRVKIRQGDFFLLVEPTAQVDKSELIIGCTLAGVMRDLEIGDRVLFDDGIFEAVVEKNNGVEALLRMIRVSTTKPVLKAEKGINFPDTELTVRALTEFDKSVIPFALDHADIIGFSFVRQASDVAELQQILHQSGKKPPSLVIKIETLEAVQNLPALLLQGMAEPSFGVMIARGDLAVEIGFERLSEIQEEILWICEAGHVPVIWATQVLETLNKSGIATRSEVTDAARAVQAECVMLNKGKHMFTVLATLTDILRRSGGHHVKKRYIFRPLNIAERFLKGPAVKVPEVKTSNKKPKADRRLHG